MRNLQVVADKDNNTLLIIATPAEYSVIEVALKKLDIPQRQVIIDVTIAEVTLTDELKFGVEWLFKGGAPSGRGSGGLLTAHVAANPSSVDAALAPRTAPAVGARAGASRTSSTTRTSRAASRRC